MRIGAVWLLLTLACSACEGAGAGPTDPAARPSPAPELPAGAYVLPPASITDMLQQCSRDVPEPGEGSWTPDAAIIIALERALPTALARQQPGHDWTGFPRGWMRQYVGIVRQGRRYVYGSFGPTEARPYRPEKDVQMVCDGGPSFFGVEYDVTARKISHLAFNGVA